MLLVLYLCEEMTLNELYPTKAWHSTVESLLVTTGKNLPSDRPGRKSKYFTWLHVHAIILPDWVNPTHILLSNCLKGRKCKMENQTSCLQKLPEISNNYIYPILSSWAGRIQQILQSDWFLEWAEFSHLDCHSGRNPLSRSIFVNELAVIVNLSTFLHFHRRIINASLTLFTFKRQGKSL